MQINLWYSKDTKQWRWCLINNDPKNYGIGDRQESGQRGDLREAMNDIATTVEYMINNPV